MEIFELEAMANLMRTVLHVAKNKEAFLEYERLISKTRTAPRSGSASTQGILRRR